MGEAVKASEFTDKQTEGYVEAEVLPEGTSGVDELLPGKTSMLLKIWMQKQVIILN